MSGLPPGLPPVFPPGLSLVVVLLVVLLVVVLLGASNVSRSSLPLLCACECRGPLTIDKAADIDRATPLLMSRKIIQHMNVMQVEAWFHWQAVQSYAKANKHWGPIRLVFKAPVKTVSVTKSYYAFKHFSTFIRPGAVPVTVSPTCKHTVSAVQFGRRLTITLVNQRGAGATLQHLPSEVTRAAPQHAPFSRYLTTNSTSFTQAVVKATGRHGRKVEGSVPEKPEGAGLLLAHPGSGWEFDQAPII